ncbi:MAG TPA: NAD(P)/FAD-dependent oxidoreductase [Syntrophales bacterium]|nr:NAD(P)/FAD-dependent oxidoreductase [Syntrophales bacterium]
MRRLRIAGVVLSLGEGEEVLKGRVASILRIPVELVSSFAVVRKSIDARRSKPPRFIYTLDCTVPDGAALMSKEGVKIEVLMERMEPRRSPAKIKTSKRPVIIGCGPAGIFAALTLAERGIPALLLDRGKSVPERVADVQSFWERGILNTESHVHFGEGGAGTFSDGKLTSRLKNPYTAWIKTRFVDAGAPSEILTDAKPHIGTDRLRDVVINLRKRLVELGCEVRFEAKVTDFLLHGGKVEGVVVRDNEEIRTDHLILASGQSAEDTYGRLYELGVHLEPKPFAIGFRVEHPQELIEAIQYGKWRGHPDLPPADYILTARLPHMKRSVYTFCMCPGGSVIGCSSEERTIVTNGMSRYRRDSSYANSAIVVAVHCEDFKDTAHHPLCGLVFRRQWEKKAFVLGGENYHAPAQRLVDFMKDSEGTVVKGTSFLPGVKPALLSKCLPVFAIEALKQGMAEFDRKMRGFITEEAMLIGVETRTSSPVRILRGTHGQSLSVSGLYPCGEGAGYAGGIISSALDGIKTAEKIAS